MFSDECLVLNEEIEGGGILNSKFQIPNSKQNSKFKTQNSELRTQKVLCD
jgi:hypothetical protein